MTIKDMKSKRDALHEELNKLTPRVDEIRNQIKDLNRELFKLEMTPVMLQIEADISAGKFEGDLLKEKQAKLDRLKSII